MQKVYGFTNEFIAAYPEIYNFENADVLSVLGSGDQYFMSVLAGAKDVTLFDFNINAWYHFVLKFMAIRRLSYEEFWQFFITDNLNNLKLYSKICEYLPKDVKKFFDIMKFTCLKFSNIKIRATFLDCLKKEDYLRMLPYLNEDNYYKLQELLNKKELPKCYVKDFVEIALSKERKDYDLLLLSNIYHWMDFTPYDFMTLLNQFDPCIIQALYSWHYSKEIENFINLGFDLAKVPAVKPTVFNDGVNYVLTYKRSK